MPVAVSCPECGQTVELEEEPPKAREYSEHVRNCMFDGKYGFEN